MADPETFEPGAIYNIYCDLRTAKNYPPSDGVAPYTRINFDHGSANFYEWFCELFGEGFRLLDVGTGFWASVRKGEIIASREFDTRTCKWHIDPVDRNLLRIKVPGENKFWTVKESDSDHGYSRQLFLEPTGGSTSQIFSFRRAIDHR